MSIIVCCLHMLRRDDVIEPAVLGEIVRDIAPRRTRWLRWVPWVFALLLLGAVVVTFLPRYLEGRTFGEALGFVPRSMVVWWAIVYGFIIWPWQRSVERRFRRSRITSALLSRKRCAHCGYNLQGQPESTEDGSTRCPECGARWRLSDDALALRGFDPIRIEAELHRFNARLAMTIVLGAIAVIVLVETAHRVLGW